MIPNTDEKHLQQNVIKLLNSMDYTFISREENVILRNNQLNEVILKNILLQQLQKINSFEYKGIDYKFSPKNISRAVEELNVPLNEGLSIANQKISDKLVLGTSYDEELCDGERKSFSLRYIDFDTPENNVFHFTEEYSVSRVNLSNITCSRRPDIVLFINGIPFAVIELKKSSVDAKQGILQMIDNQGSDKIPQMFKYVQLTLAGNNFNPKYATAGTPAEFYAVWEEDTSTNEELAHLITHRFASKLDRTLYSLFNKSRVLELLHSFILFDKRVKKVARYQQYFAIKDIFNRIETFAVDGSRAGGLVWHTQGSGKSLTMVMLAKLLKRKITGSRIIVVTDRIDLDEQIHTTFQNTEVKAVRASSGRDLIEKFRSGSSVITTLIHKFETIKNENNNHNRRDTNFEDANIFVLVDESHRTQGGDLHKAMKKVFPRACYLGFTGTPLLKREKSSIIKFGGLIHCYTIDQAVKDKAVLPLLYEGRLVDQWISDSAGLDRRFEMISRDLNVEQKEDLKQKWARFSRVASSELRLEMIALDVNEHFTKNIQGTGLKAMLATSSKYEAIKYHELFSKYGNIKTAFIISAPDTREGCDEDNGSGNNKQYIAQAWDKLMRSYTNEEDFLTNVKSEFIDGDELELLIVVDKLLTGFDAPCATVLYMDKELKEHGLLQAIARVNRLYNGKYEKNVKGYKTSKRYGFIIDYRGLLGNLDSALTSYSALAGFDEGDLIGAVIDIKAEVGKVKTFYSYLQDLFKTVVNKQDQESYQVFLGGSDLAGVHGSDLNSAPLSGLMLRKKFYELLSKFACALKLTLSSDKTDEVLTQNEINQYKKAMKFYSELRRAVKIRYHEEVDFGKYEREMQKLLDTFISANEVNQLTKLINIFEEDFDKEVERLAGDNAKADGILSAAVRMVSENRAQNPNFYDKLSKKIEQIIQEYRDGRLSDEDKLKHAQDIRSMLRPKQIGEEFSYPDEIKDRSCAKALYDNLQEIRNAVPLDEFIRILLQIDNIFYVVSKKPDWQYSGDIKNQIDQEIDDILYMVEKRLKIKFMNTSQIISQVHSIGVSNYAK
ncbi:MAG: type restriction enzyme subunit [Pseudomonadota bacterium]|nr:type restriction enzyme subunit [Pseudomonadota bacterium]